MKDPGSWGTPFSGFRFAVPEACGFKGRAIYLDADMLMLGDIAELWEMAPAAGKGIRCISENRTDVAVIDCGYFGEKHALGQWPSVSRMKPSGYRVFEYLKWLRSHRTLDTTLPKVWNDCDGMIYERFPAEVKLLHYTNVMCGQPYRPYPNVDYSNLKWPYVGGNCSVAAAKLWHAYHDEVKASA